MSIKELGFSERDIEVLKRLPDMLDHYAAADADGNNDGMLSFKETLDAESQMIIGELMKTLLIITLQTAICIEHLLGMVAEPLTHLLMNSTHQNGLL